MHHKQNKIEYTQNNTFVRGGENWPPKAEHTLLTGFTGIMDELLRKGITNSSLCYDRLKENGFQGGLTIVKDYISKRA